VPENKVLRKGSGSKKDEVNEQFRVFSYTPRKFVMYRSANVVRLVESGRFRWARTVARAKETRSTYKILFRNLLEKSRDSSVGIALG
jgi:hypothetical protein